MVSNEAESLEDDEQAEDTGRETDAEVSCPHCGETVSITLDPGGGRVQEYVEDCEVCCRPWRVRVLYHAGGAADVELQPLE